MDGKPCRSLDAGLPGTGETLSPGRTRAARPDDFLGTLCMIPSQHYSLKGGGYLEVRIHEPDSSDEANSPTSGGELNEAEQRTKKEKKAIGTTINNSAGLLI